MNVKDLFHTSTYFAITSVLKCVWGTLSEIKHFKFHFTCFFVLVKNGDH